MSFHLNGALRPHERPFAPDIKIFDAPKSNELERGLCVLTFACSTLNNVAGPSGRLTSHTRRPVLQQPRHYQPTDEKGG